MGGLHMSHNPTVSVVMSVYNAEKYLDKAIQSILNQTYKDFEFIIIDDGSKDKSLEILKRYEKQDVRIVLISRENKGLVASLNEGIGRAKGKYIARMDADDISLPRRFEEQINFISKENLDICGTFVELFNKDKVLGVLTYPEKDQDIKFILMFMTSFAHPTVFIKKSVFRKIQYKNYEHAEDYKLWTDIALMGYKMGNIGKVLLKYRLHDNQVSKIHSQEQQKCTKFIASKYRIKIPCLHIGLFAKDLACYYDSSSIKKWNTLLNNFRKISRKDRISPEFMLSAIRHVLKNSSKLNLILFFVYYFKTKEVRRGGCQEISIFIASLFGIHKKSFIYKQVKNSKLL